MSFKTYLEVMLDELSARQESVATKQSSITFIIGRMYEYFILQPEIARLEGNEIPPKIINNYRAYAHHEMLKMGIDKALADIILTHNEVGDE
jgi:hypothetical protein